jgi:phosphotriesterase-related protein
VTAVVRTLRGDIDPSVLGRTNYHEHLFQVTPLLRGEELDDPVLSEAEAANLVASGFEAMIDATPLGLGRRVADAAAISQRTGLHVVHATGAHHGGHYADDHPIRALDEAALAALFTREIREGFVESPFGGAGDRDAAAGPARAGIVKTGIRFWSIGAFERRVLAAAAVAHGRTGVAIMVHIEHGSATFEVLDILAQAGVPANRVILAHMDRNVDSGLHRELAATGAYLGYDGAARHQYHSDEAILECATRVAQAHADRLLLGGDVARRSRYIAYGGMPGLGYLATRFVPRLAERIGDAAVDGILRANPARVLAFEPSA